MDTINKIFSGFTGFFGEVGTGGTGKEKEVPEITGQPPMQAADTSSLSEEARMLQDEKVSKSSEKKASTPEERRNSALDSAQNMIASTPGFSGYDATIDSMRKSGKLSCESGMKNIAQYDSLKDIIQVSTEKGSLDRDFDAEAAKIRSSILSPEQKADKLRKLELSKFDRDLLLAGSLVHEGDHKKESVSLNRKKDELKAYTSEVNFYARQLEGCKAKEGDSPEVQKEKEAKRNIIKSAINSAITDARTKEGVNLGVSVP
ncbi:MAG: hypothetical protein RDV48_30165 [Candidatus Eremiobacteraeota bacterium]|nr:hypothetical protein [Candidatus Eremiobacteraeota bacterium]